MSKIQHLNFVQYATRVLVSLFIVLLFSSAHAASIGRLSVLSSAGQPFRAEAEVLFVFQGEFESMSAKLASKEAFKRANIAFNPALELLHFSVEQNDGRYFIRITSQQPITEPSLGIVLELSSNRGRSERGYVVLLDPVKWNNLQKEASKTNPIATIKSRAPQEDPNKQLSEGTLTKPVEKTEIPKQPEKAGAAEATAPVQSPGRIAPPVPPASQRAAEKAAEKKAGVEVKPSSYQVNRGDTLRSIVARFKPDNVSLEQMLVATYRRNPDAFMNNNMNLLRLNATIEAPSKQSATKISDNQARRIVRAQTAAFHRYRDQLAGEVARAPRATAQPRAPQIAPPAIARAPVENKRSTSGQITTRANEPRAPEKQGADKLELSKGNIKPDNQSVITLEEKIAIEKSLEDANVRMAEMEKNINELRGLLDVINKNAAANQAAAPPAVAAEGSITAKAPAAPITTVTAPEKKELFLQPQPVYTDLWDRLTKDLVFALTVGGFVILIPILLYVWYRKRKAKTPVFIVPKYTTPPNTDKGNEVLNVSSVIDKQRDELEKQAAEEESYPSVISGKDFLLGRKSYTEEERKALFLDESEQNQKQRGLSASPDSPEMVEDIVQLSGAVAASSKVENVVSDADLAQVEPVPAVKGSMEDNGATVENITLPMKESVSEEESLPEPRLNEEATVDDMAETLIEDAPEEEPEDEHDDVEDESSVEESVEEESLVTELPEELPEDVPKEEETAPLDFDFSKINLDLDASDVTPIQSVPQNPEMEVKLELALAYMDMADKEGARDLLEEVAELGTPQQAVRAKEILSQL